MLTWLQIGDPHIVTAGAENIRDLGAIIAAANANLSGTIDFAFLPGDVADNGTEAQYRLARDALSGLRIPLHAIPGDHDFQPRNPGAFHAVLGARALPYGENIGGWRCIFLDVVSAGSGGPDFRLGAAQIAWLDRELAGADASGQTSAVFMHTYPADLCDEALAVRRLFARSPVAFVGMGHTHYNELANDGRTIYAATRSTGQIEEGAVGFSIAALDSGNVSWRFKPLHAAWPFALITAPADYRLMTDPQAQVARGRFEVRARAWSAHGIVAASCRIDEGNWLPMQRSGPVWARVCEAPASSFRLIVRVSDAAGGVDSDIINPAAAPFAAPVRHADGSDRDAIGAWPEKGILGTQLGPNRNGRPW